MKFFSLVFLVLGISGFAPVFSQEVQFTDRTEIVLAALNSEAIASDSDNPIPNSIRNNQFYLESLHYIKLAQDYFDRGDYDQSTEFADKAMRYARMSDDYVAEQLRKKAADDAIASATAKLAWADTVKAPKRYPIEYASASGYFDSAQTDYIAKNWENAAENALQVLAALSAVTPLNEIRLPSQYTVRTWRTTRDCLWNIAASTWVYNDPWKWKILYQANKNTLEVPNNPNLIEPGMILTIPSINGELREGMWLEDVDYPVFKNF